MSGWFRRAADAIFHPGGGGGGQGVGLNHPQQQHPQAQAGYPGAYQHGGGQQHGQQGYQQPAYPPYQQQPPQHYDPYAPVAYPYAHQPYQQGQDQHQHQQGGGGGCGRGRGGRGRGRGAGRGRAGRAQQHGEEHDEDEDAGAEDERAEVAELAALHDGDDDEDVTQDAHVAYVPARVKGGQPHPGHVVETRALAGVLPPPLTYKSLIPRSIVKDGKVSLLQLESAMYAMQMHERRLPTGERAGWVLADGTGIGKGRIIASIVYENTLRGRDRAVWVTASPFLAEQIKRDVKDIGLRIRIHELKGDVSRLGPGLMVTTYKTLINESGGVPRVDQLVEWLGGDDWDGLLALDEAHKAKNLKTKRTRGKKEAVGDPIQASKTAKVIFDLQQRLPHARVVYSSATIATNPDNLECLSRLGLWGPRTSFPDSGQFADAMRKAGLPGLELLALNLKAEGKYLSRCLGFHGCEFQIERAPISAEFEQIYDACARQWDELRRDLELIVPTNFRRRRKRAGEEEAEEDPEAEAAKAKLWCQYWSSHQRFFKSLYVASKVPFVIKQARAAIQAGFAPVIGLQTTGEAQIRQATTRDEAGEEEISQCAHVMDQFLRNHVVDALDREDNQIPGLRARHLQWLGTMQERLPGNALDELIAALGGPSQVAELTGRTLRPEEAVGGAGGARKYKQVNVSQRTHERERKAFQSGEKKAAIISEAASVGISLHADKREASAKKRRIHFVLELAWGADRVMQQLGRSHRSNQESGPVYKLLTCDRMGGDSRFVSTVARRLQILGAITQGHEGAANKTLDLREFNVEGEHGEQALKKLLKGEGIELQHVERHDVQSALALLNERIKKEVSVPRFLNTVLGFELAAQEIVVGAFFRLWAAETARAKQDGSYTQLGIVNLRGEKVEVEGRPTTYLAPPPALPAVAEAADGAAPAAAAPVVVDVEEQEAQQKQEEQKQQLTVLSLTLDRGLSYGHALQALLEATKGGAEQARAGESGFYLPSNQPRRPLLALHRPGGLHNGDVPTFKILWPDMGRQAYTDLTQDELRAMQYLSPQAAEPLWTQRYQAALTTCFHGRQRCCTGGRRLRTCHMLVFNLSQHWALVQKLVGQKKRMRVLRAETTSVPRKRFVGVMLSPYFKRKLERMGLHVVPLAENPEPVVIAGGGAGAAEGQEDGKVDIFSLLEGAAVIDLLDDEDEEEQAQEQDAMTVSTASTGGGKAGGTDTMVDLTELGDELESDEEEDELYSDEEEDGEATESEAELEIVAAKKEEADERRPLTPTGPVKREGGSGSTGSTPSRSRRRVEMEEDDEVQIIGEGTAGARAGPGTGAANAAGAFLSSMEEDGAGIDAEIEEAGAAMDVVTLALATAAAATASAPAREVIDVSSDEEEEAAQAVEAVEEVDEAQEDAQEHDDELVDELMDELDELEEEGLLERPDKRELRKRARRNDAAVVAAFMESRGADMAGKARAFKRVLGAAM